MSGKRPTSAASSNSIPTKWAVGLIVALIFYALLQPVLNRQFGWQLPSLAALQQGDTATSNASKPEQTAPEPTQGSKGDQDQLAQGQASEAASGFEKPVVATEANTSQPVATSAQTTALKPTAPKSAANALPPKSTSPSKTNSSPKNSSAKSTESLRYGVLRETATDDFLSPGGLRYTRGSAEGHRLKHIERHLTDDPGRPGKHGVFDGDMGQVIRWIDEAYDLAKRGAKGTSKQEEDGRMVYEASFAKPIGFIGGRDGRRDQNPDARRLRLVVEGNKVITAFPF